MKSLLAFAAAGWMSLVASLAPAQVRINEIRTDEPGTDVNEYFELAGPPGTPLAGLTYVILGDTSTAPLGSGVIEEALDLTGSVIPASGLFVAAEGTFALGVANLTTLVNFENSDNVTHLLVTGYTGTLLTDLDTNDDGVLDVTPWTSVVDLVAVILQNNPPATTEYHYGPPLVGPDGAFAPGHVFRNPDGAAVLSSWNVGAFAAGVNDSPGAPNPIPGISVALGGTQRLNLDAGPANAGAVYLMATNFTGTVPGLPVPPVLVPLNFDPLVQISLTNANGAIWTNTFGFLDANGRAFASFNVPVLGPVAAGLMLNSAAIVLTPLGVPVLASNPVPLNLVP
ncbi:MAG: hypothetical protein L0323_08355 [Planctomycetes bacterium]|nr:hypothetical protein [Planctomycetota bacterium]